VADSKSIKTEAEIEGFRQCHIRDGAALVIKACLDTLLLFLTLAGPVFLVAGAATSSWGKDLGKRRGG
jgi:hypothetical protein